MKAYSKPIQLKKTFIVLVELVHYIELKRDHYQFLLVFNSINYISSKNET